MTLVEKYGPQLPYLRRFARALTGEQARGDLYVRMALEALAAGDAELSDTAEPKLGLFKMFLGIWNTTGALLETASEADNEITARIREITPLSRQAFLLSSIEGLNSQEIAFILSVPFDVAKELLLAAEAEIEAQLRTNVLIIEDEPIIAADIEGLVEELGHTVDAIAATRKEAVNAAKVKKPGIVLADVQLADGSSGIDAVSDIMASYDVPVIFITAFPERLLTGDKPEPAFLISKPFQPDNVKAVISQALFFHHAG